MKFKILLLIGFVCFYHTINAQSKKNKNRKEATKIDTTVLMENIGNIGVESYELQEGDVSHCPTCNEELIRFEKMDGDRTKYGFRTRSGMVIIPAVYDAADYRFNENYNSMIVRIGSNYAIINKKGAFIIPFKYKSIRLCQDNLFIVKNQQDKMGVIDLNDKTIVPFIFDDLYKSDYDNILRFRKGLNAGLYSMFTNSFILNDTYTDINVNQDNKFIIAKKSKAQNYWFEWPSMKLIDSTYTDISPLSNGKFLVTKKSKKGVVTLRNEIVVPIIYDEIERNWSQDDVFIVTLNNKQGLLTNDNRKIIDIKYDAIDYQNKCYVVNNSNKYGIIDGLTFQETIPCMYDYLYVKSPDRILAKKGSYYGIVRYNNEIVMEFKMEFFSDNDFLYNSLPVVYKKGKLYGLLDQTFSELFPPIYDSIITLKASSYNGFFVTVKGKNKLLYNKNGEQLLDVSKYDGFSLDRNYQFDYIVISKSNKFGLLNLKTLQESLPCEYEFVGFNDQNKIVVYKNNLYYKCIFDINNSPQLIRLD